MNQTMVYPESVIATLNFAADRNFGGIFSNDAPEAVEQRLEPVKVDIRNMRQLQRSPTLQVEGFALATHASGAADWSNPDWIESDYVSSCIKLVKKLTGATHALSMHTPMLRRRDKELQPGASLPATFIHMDQTRDAGRDTAGRFAKARGYTCERGAIYNVWKALTPGPQDMPLAIADWRTASENDHVVGMSYEPVMPGRDAEVVVPHVCLAHTDKEADWFFVPDMTINESLVFVGVDFDPDHPLGCPHSAFVLPDPDGITIPRASLETRVIVFD